MTTAPAPDREPSDAELITAVREGSTDAYATLYARHRAAAYNLARQLAHSPSEVDDLVSEAFARLLDALRGGGGPDSAYRAYLLTALRHCAYDRTRRERKIELTEDETAYDAGVPFSDTAVAGLDRSLAARAFATLPERWQTVLWHTEIEGQAAAEIAPLLGLSPNGVSALAYRAREALKQAYLQVHLADRSAAGAGVDRCRAAVDRLGAWTRSGLSKRETAQVEQHLDECGRCRALAVELADVNGGLRVFVAPLVLGSAATAYLAAVKSSAAAAGLATAGAVGAAGAGTGATGSVGVTGGGMAAVAISVPRLLSIAGSTATLTAAVVAGLVTGPSASTPGAIQQDRAVQSPTPVMVASQPTGAPATGTSEGPLVALLTPGLDGAGPSGQPGQSSVGGLTASVPGGPVQLTPGGDAVSIPVTVRNSGDPTAAPVMARLTLPTGVRATGTATGGSCSNGAGGSIQCTSAGSLGSGEQVVFTIALRAELDAVSGTITGTLSAGPKVSMPLSPIQVVVAAVDAVDLSADTNGNSGQHTWLEVRAENAGSTTHSVVVDVVLPDGAAVHPGRSDCAVVPGGARCTATLAPGDQGRWRMWLYATADVQGTVTVTATLGTAQRGVTVPIDLQNVCGRANPPAWCP